MTEEEQASIREWAESRVIDRSQKTRPLADVIAEARRKTMTKADELKALANRCERDEPSRELDGSIAAALGLEHGPWETVYVETRSIRSGAERAPAYTTSLDAAVSLVPAGSFWLRKSQYAMTCACEATDKNGWFVHIDGKGARPALALCAAALRARAALPIDGAEPQAAKVRTSR